MKSVIRHKIDSIAKCIYAKVRESIPDGFSGLYTGDFGILLFLFYYSRYSKDKKYISLTEAYAEILLDQIAKEPKSHTFCSGLAGITMMYHRMCIETHRNEFKEATDYWLNQIINFSQFRDGLAGYKTS